MLPALIAGGTAAYSLYSLLKNIVNANTPVSPEELAGEVERRAMALSQQSGITVEAAKAAIAEATKADLEKDHEFDWGGAIGDVLLGAFPAAGLVKAARAGTAAGQTALQGAKGMGWQGLLGVGPTKAAPAVAPAAAPAAAAPAAAAMETPMDMSAEAVARRARNTPFDEQAAEYDIPSVDEMLGAAPKAKAKRAPRKAATSTPGEEAAEVANPGLRAAHGAEEAGEYVAPGDLTPAEVAEAEASFARMRAQMPQAPDSDDLIRAAQAARASGSAGGKSTARQAFMEALTK